MSFQRRTAKNGDVTRVVNVTIPESFYDELRMVSLKERVTINKVVRAALLVGASKMKSEYARMDRGEENKVGRLRVMYKQDGRISKVPNVTE
jgi:hypothetical protein